MSKQNNNLELSSPPINLRSNSKVQFKNQRKRKYEKYLKSPFVRGKKLWDILPEKVQKATAKVKLKCLVKKICRT